MRKMRILRKICGAFLAAFLLAGGMAAPAKCDERPVSVPAAEAPENVRPDAETLSEGPSAGLTGASQYVRGYVEGYARYDLASAYLDKLNAYRKSCGAGSLCIDQSLSDYAMQRAAEQLCYFGHTRPDGSSCFDEAVFGGTWHGETAWFPGTLVNADMIFNAFRGSPAHDAISKDNVYKAVGIGIVQSKDGYIGVVCDYRSTGTPATVKTTKEKKTWSFNVSPDYFVPALTPEKVSTDDARRLLTVRGRCYNLPSLPGATYSVSGGTGSIRSSSPSVAAVENGCIIPKRAGTAALAITAAGRTYTAKITVAQGTKTVTPTPTPTPKPEVPKKEDPKTVTRSYAGTYTIRSAKNQNFVIDIAGGSRKSCANVQLYAANGTEAQVFIIREAGNGYYTITNRRSGKLLDVSGASRRSGTNVHQYTANGTIAQLWKIQENKDGTVTFVSKLGTVLDVSGGLMQNGRNIQAYSPNGTIAQKWVLDKN